MVTGKKGVWKHTYPAEERKIKPAMDMARGSEGRREEGRRWGGKERRKLEVDEGSRSRESSEVMYRLGVVERLEWKSEDAVEGRFVVERLGKMTVRGRRGRELEIEVFLPCSPRFLSSSAPRRIFADRS